MKYYSYSLYPCLFFGDVIWGLMKINLTFLPCGTLANGFLYQTPGSSLLPFDLGILKTHTFSGVFGNKWALFLLSYSRMVLISLEFLHIHLCNFLSNFQNQSVVNYWQHFHILSHRELEYLARRPIFNHSYVDLGWLLFSLTYICA